MFKMIVFSFLVIFPREIKADFPKLNKRELIIYANPATLEGKLVKRHLETDWIAYATKKTSDKEILKTIGEYEARRKIIHKYFHVKIVETSDDLYFRIGKYSTKIYFPEVTTGVHPNEYPGYIDFFFWVVDTHYHDYFKKYHKAICDNIRSKWSRDFSTARDKFIAAQEKKGYEYVGYEFHPELYWEEGFSKKNKNEQYAFFTMEQLGWKRPDPPIFPDPPELRKCHINTSWKLPF